MVGHFQRSSGGRMVSWPRASTAGAAPAVGVATTRNGTNDGLPNHCRLVRLTRTGTRFSSPGRSSMDGC